MIVVATPTGNIGHHVVHLLDAGEAVRVVARDPGRLPPMVRHAQVPFGRSPGSAWP